MFTDPNDKKNDSASALIVKYSASYALKFLGLLLINSMPIAMADVQVHVVGDMTGSSRLPTISRISTGEAVKPPVAMGWWVSRALIR